MELAGAVQLFRLTLRRAHEKLKLENTSLFSAPVSKGEGGHRSRVYPRSASSSAQVGYSRLAVLRDASQRARLEHTAQVCLRCDAPQHEAARDRARRSTRHGAATLPWR